MSVGSLKFITALFDALVGIFACFGLERRDSQQEGEPDSTTNYTLTPRAQASTGKE